ncbi:MAG: hypothetical protein HOP23_17965 [Methylococcaceae bacterium]|nr:hypothetical protein [Methylococcaceae bacterium]
MNKKQVHISPTTETDLEEQALSQFNSGRYKDAIELYKKLLQNSENSVWRQQLAYCYLQRAFASAAKGQCKEALVLWENYSQHVQPPYQGVDHYITWLIHIKNRGRIQSCLSQLTAQQLDKQYPELAILLGFLMMTEYPEFQEFLPQDSTLISHQKIVQTALQAYREHNLKGVDQALKALPYRSAFRDIRTVLKALVAASTSHAEMQLLLSKMPVVSVYSQSARLLKACTLKGAMLVHEMMTFNHQQRRLLGEILELNRQQVELIESLSKHTHWSDKIKFNLAIHYQSLFGTDVSQRFCFTMLTRYSAGQRDFNKAFGSINDFEANRLKALAHEHNNNSYDADFYWRQCINALSHEVGGNDLRIALILRHMSDMQSVQEQQTQLLIESLDYDPDDKDCYLKILSNTSQHTKTSKSYQEWLCRALGRFPQDVDVLTQALQSASRSKSHTKVIKYALQILNVDSLNTFARHELLSSYLTQSRLLIRNKKYHLVENEIAQAENLKMGKYYVAQTQLLRGLLCFAAQDKTQGLLLITEALKALNTGPVNMHFQATIEALLTAQPVATLLRTLPPVTEHLLSAQELSHFTQLLTRYGQEASNYEYLHKALDKVKASLKKSVSQQNYQENLLLALCQTLDTIHHFELLRHCAKWAQAKWQKPIWIYYKIHSETNGNPERCSYINCFRLQDNLERARQEKDHRTSVLIGDYLERYAEVHPARGMDFLGNLFESNVPEEVDDPFEKLFGHVPDEIFYKLNKKLETLAKKTTPERLIQELSKVIGHDANILQAMMLNPDLFMALLILKAADELGVNIDVRTEDVLACFGVVNKPRSFSI